jgi:hypothetical protein
MSEAAHLLSKLNANERPIRTLRATVSAYREDGLVNLTYGTAHIYGVPCLASYSKRTIGDTVQVLDLGSNTWVVLGVIGNPDTAYVGPNTQNTGYSMYSTATLAAQGTIDPAFEGYVGAASDNNTPVLLAWSYYNGTSNVLTTGASGKTSVTVTVARTNVLHGKSTAIDLRLCPHNFNTLPTTISLDTDSFSPVVFRLEIGEVRSLSLPSDWVTAITATTPTIKGFAVRPLITTPWDSSYVIFSRTSGGFRAV